VALAAVIIPGHHEQGDKASFMIRGEERCCCSYSLKIKMEE
jgi:hypothetical protein